MASEDRAGAAPPAFELRSHVLDGTATAVVEVNGELDLYTAPEFRDKLLEAGDGRDVIVDLRGSSFIDSTGCRALLLASRRLEPSGHRLVIVNSDAEIARIFSIMGFEELFTIVATLEEAQARLAADVRAAG
jgi:anti-sigma B factor antagonist